jgi:branched-chain amino acid transport system ATP-binding protein
VPDSTGALLEITDLTKAFGGVRAVNGLSFRVQAGEIVGLLGPNGSGKTTVFNLIAGALPADGGQVHFAGRRITTDPPSRRARAGIARTFQLVRVFPNLTALENVAVACLYGRERSRTATLAREDARVLLARAGMTRNVETPAASLALGDRKRVEIARALAGRPRLLLLDEPAGGLNPTEVDEQIALFRRLREDGITVMLVEHNVRAVRTLCDRVVVMHAGRKIADGTPEDAFRHAEVVRVYLGRA